MAFWATAGSRIDSAAEAGYTHYRSGDARLTPNGQLHSVLTTSPLAFLVDILQAPDYLTGAAIPGTRAEKGGRPSGVGRCGDTRLSLP